MLRFAALAAVVSVPAVAYADFYGAAGPVMSVTLNESAADDYSIERGSIMVSEGGTLRKYAWGGVACSGRFVVAENVALLFSALANADRISIVPSYKTGAGLSRCLVGFKFATLAKPVGI